MGSLIPVSPSYHLGNLINIKFMLNRNVQTILPSTPVFVQHRITRNPFVT